MNVEWQAQIQQAYRDFLAGRGVKARRGQAHMVADIAKSFAAIQEDEEGLRTSNKQLIAIEAGTGTGNGFSKRHGNPSPAQAADRFALSASPPDVPLNGTHDVGLAASLRHSA